MMAKNIDDHLLVVGNFGVYQLSVVAIMGFLIASYCMQMFVTIFTHGDQAFRCVDDLETDMWNAFPCYNDSLRENTICEKNTITVAYDRKCTIHKFGKTGVNTSAPCDKFEYDTSLHFSTIISEYDLVCEKAYIVTIIDVAWMVTDGIGSVSAAYFSDRYGRKWVIILTFLGLGVFGSLSAFAQSIWMYAICRCAMALIISAGLGASVALAAELTSPTKRSHSLNSLGICWILGSFILPGLAYLIPQWKYLQLAISILCIPVGVASYWLIDESPHWLLVNNRPKDSLLVLKKMARWNKVTEPDDMDGTFEMKTEEDSPLAEESGRESCCAIWRHKRILVRFIVFSIGWVSCSFCYYTLSFGVSGLPGNIYVNIIIMTGAEGLAYVLCFSVAWIGRKWPTIGAFFAAAATLLTSALVMAFVKGIQFLFISSSHMTVGGTSRAIALGTSIFMLSSYLESGLTVTVLSCFGKFFVSGAWQILFVWANEIYPTSHRCTLASLTGLFGKIGNVLAPVMLGLNKVIETPNKDLIIPIMYTIFMLGAGFLHMMLPETKNTIMPDNYEMANLPRLNRVGKVSPAAHHTTDPDERDNFL